MSQVPSDRHVVITGPMGTGKTTLGRGLARRTGRVFFDSDVQLRATYGRTGKELAARVGVAELHRYELELFTAAVETREPAVIAAAASVADHADPLLAAAAAGHVLVYLEAPARRLAAFASEGAHRRPVSSTETAALSQVRRGNAIAAGALAFAVDRSVAPEDSVARLAALLGLA